MGLAVDGAAGYYFPSLRKQSAIGAVFTAPYNAPLIASRAWVTEQLEGHAASPSPTPTPEPAGSALEVLPLALAKRQLRLTTDDADDIVLDAIEGAVAFVADAAGVTLATIAASDTLRQAVIVAMRAFFNGFETIPPQHAVWSLINAGAPC